MKKLLGFGASTMQGVGDPAGGFMTRLSSSLQEQQVPVTVINEGIGGNTTRDMLARVNKLPQHAPYDLVVILGCNDMPRDPDNNPKVRTSLPEYNKNLHTLLKSIQGERSLFITSFSVSEKKTGVAPALFQSYMAGALEIATSFGYDIWDLNTETRDIVQELWAQDGIHFNDKGHALLAEKVDAWYLGKTVLT